MTIGDPLHIAIRAIDLEVTIAFYRDALGLIELPRPAALSFPGAWIGSPTSKTALIHVYANEAAAYSCNVDDLDNERGRVDHIAFGARGFSAYRDRLTQLGLSFREQHLNGSPLWQLFVHDPNGLKIELSFNEAEEPNLLPALFPGLKYSQSERFFDQSEYVQFKQTRVD